MKRLFVVLILVAAVGLTGCKEAKSIEVEVKPIRQNSFQVGYEVDKMMDEDLLTGWIAEKSIEANGSEVVEIDLGEVRTISSISLDDTFPDGYTNEIDPYDPVDVLIADWDCTTWEGNDTPERLFDGMVGRKGWRADIVPTAEEPVFVVAQLSETKMIGKIELNNQGYGTVPKSFEIQVSLDGESYTTVYTNEANDKDKLVCTLDEAMETNYIKYTVYDQSGETVSLDEMVLYTLNADKVFEHYPRKFSILVAGEDAEYEVLVMENANDASLWHHTFEPREVRYIKYVVMAEFGDNKPSVGELIIK